MCSYRVGRMPAVLFAGLSLMLEIPAIGTGQHKGKPDLSDKKETTFEGVLTALVREGKHALKLAQGQHYAILLESRGFITSLQVYDTRGMVHATGSGFVPFLPAADGDFFLVVRADSGSCGTYFLSVRPVAPPRVTPLVLAPKDGATVVDSLTIGDSLDRVRKTFCKMYDVKLGEGQTYIIDLISENFDAFLRLEDAGGKQLAQDDDSGGKLNARITFQPNVAGVYRIFATALGGNKTGAFVLKVRQK